MESRSSLESVQLFLVVDGILELSSPVCVGLCKAGRHGPSSLDLLILLLLWHFLLSLNESEFSANHLSFALVDPFLHVGSSSLVI